MARGLERAAAFSIYSVDEEVCGWYKPDTDDLVGVGQAEKLFLVDFV